MKTDTNKKMLWIGWTLSVLAILFLSMDAVVKLFELQPAIEGTVELGYPEGTVFGLGLILIVCTILYAIPRTAVLGAILLTAYLGGAVATHVRMGNPLFSHVLFPTYIAIFVWGGLLLRYGKPGMILHWKNTN